MADLSATHVWLEFPATGGKAQFSIESAEGWQARGWVPCDPAPDPGPRMHDDPEPEPEPPAADAPADAPAERMADVEAAEDIPLTTAPDADDNPGEPTDG